MSQPETYAEFWPYYLRAHARRGTRVLHYAGTLLGLAFAGWAIGTGRAWLALAAPAIGYAFAWGGHFGHEKNVPATFRYPLWSFVSDFRMLALALTLRLRPHLAASGVR